MMVAMNPQTFDKDVASIEPGGYLFYDSSRPIPASKLRDDIVVLGMPLTDICTREYAEPRQRQLFKNIVYVGALAALLDIEIGEVEKLIGEQFKGKDRLIAPNLRALRIGYDDARSRFACPLGIRVVRSDAVGNRILADGNFAAGLGAVYGGATVCAWYPITPSTSLAEAFEKNCARLRVDRATGEKRYAIVQAEDEIAAIGMVVGAGWNGARAFTATSGPGISLMQEFLGLAYFAEIPDRRVRRAARRPFDGHADAHPAIGCACPALSPRTATPNMCCCFPTARARLSNSARSPSISPTGCRRRFSSCSISTSA